MKFCSISDVHLSDEYPERFDLFVSFCRSEEVLSSNMVFLLGDIFDLMICHKKQYLKKYRPFFDEIKKILNLGIKIIYIEGNHDFHTGKIFHKFINDSDLNTDLFTHLKSHKVLEVNGKNIHLSHGDILDETLAYRRWKRIYSSSVFEKTIEHLLPFKIIELIGSRASKNSKKRSGAYFNYEKERVKYREAFKRFNIKHDFDLTIMGHTHIEESFALDDGKKYFNNGFFSRTKKFFYFDGEEGRLVHL